jgi:hypothetical protein
MVLDTVAMVKRVRLLEIALPELAAAVVVVAIQLRNLIQMEVQVAVEEVVDPDLAKLVLTVQIS